MGKKKLIIHDVNKSFIVNGQSVDVLKDINLEIPVGALGATGEAVAEVPAAAVAATATAEAPVGDEFNKRSINS